MKKLTSEKDKKIGSLERQLDGAEITIKNLKETNKHLNEENKYLREKNERVERNLFHKETIIETLNAQVEKLTQELQQIDGKLYNSGL